MGEQYLNDIKNLSARLRGQKTKPAVVFQTVHSPFRAGDWVRVRSLEEIEATLNHARRLKGCSFMPEMEQYCGSTQRILKPVTRFVDERDLSVHNCRGIVILENITCKGTMTFGNCDRNCFLFWREEWLENIG